MRKTTAASSLTITIIFVSLWLLSFRQTQNQPPVVKIITPKNNDVIIPGAPANYQVSVIDKEDGDSKYDEINAKEVLLEVRYLKDKSKAAAAINKPAQADPPGLKVIRTSNCFSCHNFNSKAMGPSFYEIGKKYKTTKANLDSLIKRISAGSTGIWGKEKMPSHPELSAGEIKSTVLWILKNGTNTSDNYLIGLSGIIPATAVKSNGAYVLTASYIDHGLKTTPGKQRLEGQDIVVLYVK